MHYTIMLGSGENLQSLENCTKITLISSWFCSGIAAGNPEIPIRINLIAPPVYVMTCSTPDKADGLAVLTDGCKVVFFDQTPSNLVDDTIVQAVEEKIVGSGGNFVMQMAPKVNHLFKIRHLIILLQ